jgi:hypothetical protein
VQVCCPPGSGSQFSVFSSSVVFPDSRSGPGCVGL